MTVATKGTDETIRGSAYAVELRAAAPLIRAVKNALVCASTEDHMPAICSVQFLFDGQTLEIRSTDRFLALFEQVGVEPPEDGQPAHPSWQFLLPRAAVPQVLTFLKSVAKLHPVTIAWEPSTDQEWSAGSVRLSSYESSATFTAIDSPPPKLQALVPAPERFEAQETVGYRRSNLAALAKIEAETKDPHIRIRLAGMGRVTRADWPGERRTVLVMSSGARAFDTEDWGVPGL